MWLYGRCCTVKTFLFVAAVAVSDGCNSRLTSDCAAVWGGPVGLSNTHLILSIIVMLCRFVMLNIVTCSIQSYSVFRVKMPKRFSL